MTPDEGARELRDNILMQYELVALLTSLEPMTETVRRAHKVANEKLFAMIEEYAKFR